MKSRTRKLAWLLSATMVFTSVNPGMMVMASEENEMVEQGADEVTDPLAEEEESEEEIQALSEMDEDLTEEIVDENEVIEETEAILDVEEYAVEENEPIVVQNADAEERTINSVSMTPKKTVGYVGLDDAYPFNFNTVTINYSDGKSEEWYLNGPYVTSKTGNQILDLVPKYLKKGNEELLDAINSEGEYAVAFYLNDKVVSTTDYFYTKKSIGTLPKLEAGKSNSVKSNDDPEETTSLWYEFTPTKTGKYYFDNVAGLTVKKKTVDGIIWIPSYEGSFKAEEGVTYYIQFVGNVWENNIQLYEWNTNFSIIKEIQSVDNVVPRRTEWAMGIEDDFLSGTTMRVHYTNGTEESVTVNKNYEARDTEGNRITFGIKKEADENFQYSGSNSLTAGTYGCDIYVDGQKVGDTGYIYKVVDASTASYPTLGVGTSTATTGASYFNWYKFVPTQTGRYLFAGSSQLSLCVKDVSGNEKDTDRYVVELTQGEIYYVGFYGNYNFNTKKYEVNDVNINISTLKDIVSVSNIELPKTEFYAGMDRSYFEGIKATIHFKDGSTKDVYFDSEDDNEVYLSECRQTVRPFLKNKNGKIDSVADIPVGTYEVGVEIVDSDDETKGIDIQLDKNYAITVKNVSEGNFPELKVGDNEIQSSSKWGQPNWYKFIAPEDAQYSVLKCSELMVKKKTNSGMQDVNSSNHRFEAEKDVVYYLGFEGGIYEEDDDAIYSWTTAVVKVNEIAEITNIQLAKKEFAADIDWGFVEGAKIDVKYSNGQTETLTFTDTNEVMDRYGTRIVAYINDKTAAETQNKGQYTLSFYEFSNDNKKIALSASIDESAYKISVEDISEVATKELKLGENTIESSGAYGYGNWYKFKPVSNGRHYFTMYDRYYIYEINDGKPECIYDSYDGTAFDVKANQVYYIGFRGNYSGKSEMLSALTVKNITVKSSKNTFYADIQQNHVWATVAITYENDTVEEIYLQGSSNIKDSYGNSYTISLKSENGDREWEIEDALSAGKYLITIQWDQGNIARSYSINVVDMPIPATDSSVPVTTLVSGVEYPVSLNKDEILKWFAYTPQSDCSIIFQSTGIGDSYVELFDSKGTKIDEDDDGGDNRNFCLRRKLTGGQTYYLLARMYDCGEEGLFNVSLTLEGHTHSYVEERKDATCTATGYTQQKCSSCGEVKPGSYAVLPAKGHSFGGYVETTHPTALAEGVQTRTCTVCGYSENAVVGRLAANVTLSASTLPLQVKQSISLTKLITAMTTGDRLVSCTTSNKKIATVNNAGKVTGKKAGKVKITMNFASGISKTVTVKVQKKKVATSKITNVPGSITLNVKKTYKLSPVIAPITTKDKASYKTANKKIATVSKKGVITAKKAGKTTITIKVGKKKKKVKVTVKK